MLSKKLMLVVALFLGACSDRCIRNSDCAYGMSCQRGMCEPLTPTDMAQSAIPMDFSAPAPDLFTPDLKTTD